jgi:hypothetical protein
VFGQQWSGNDNTIDLIFRFGKVGIGTNNPVGGLEVFDLNGNTFLNNTCNSTQCTNTANVNVSSLSSGNNYVGLVINGQIVDSKIINKL